MSVLTVNGTLILSGTGAVADQSSNQVFDLNSGGLLDLQATGSVPPLETIALDPNSTVRYSGAAQTIENSAPIAYGHLVLAGSGTKTIENDGDLDIAGNLTIGVNTTLDGDTNNEDIDIDGNWTNNGSYDETAQAVTFSGSALQTISGTAATTFNTLNIANTAGVSLSGVNAIVTGVLALGANKLMTGSSVIIANGTVTRVATGFVIGNLQKPIATGGPNVTFEVGTGTTYSPATTVFTGVARCRQPDRFREHP